MDRNDSHQPGSGEPAGEISPMHLEGKAVEVEPEIAYPAPIYPQDELTSTLPAEWIKKVPGEVEQLQKLVANLSGTASNIGEQVRRLKSVNVDTFWNGDAAKAFTGYKEQLPPPLSLAQKRYHGTAHALRIYTQSLHDIKQTARRAIQEATEAKHFIESHGHHVSEWRMYTQDGPVYRPMPMPMPEPPPLPHPEPLPYPEPIAHPGHPDGATVLPNHHPDGATVLPAGSAHSAAIGQRFMPQPLPKQISGTLMAEFERFGASVKLMESAIDLYDEAAKKCAAGIRTAIDDDLKNTAGYSKSMTALKHKLNANLAAIAPQLQGQLGRITGVASLLGWLPMIAAFAGNNPQNKKTLKDLTQEAKQWKSAHGDGKQIVDDFLKVLASNTDKAAAAVGHAGSAGHAASTVAAPHPAQEWKIGTEHIDAPAKVVEGTITPEQPAAGTTTPDNTAIGVSAPAMPSDGHYSFTAGPATINIDISGLSQLATHTVPVPAGV
ncbi:MAG TPA: hypothetical protein VHC49_17010 [Mycobacteriales bacterium]|nr:hypothetical protein [Mycobacteriales bacterium]